MILMVGSRAGRWRLLGAGVWLSAVLALGCSSAVGQTAPSQDGAQALIRQSSEQLLNRLRTDRERLLNDAEALREVVAQVLVPVLDFDVLSRLVLGRHFRKATPTQRQRFAQEFRDMLLRSYTAPLLKYADDIQIDYLPAVPSQRADRTMVRTRLSYRGSQGIPIDYRLRFKDGQWLVYDVKIMGLSAVGLFRQTFNADIQRLGIERFLARLAERSDRDF